MVVKKSKASLNEAVEFLNNGGVVIFPTDTVYGFLALAENKKAVAKIYRIKKIIFLYLYISKWKNKNNPT